jgi:molybdopterin-guanine dinucleotide biosynthesis protein A
MPPNLYDPSMYADVSAFVLAGGKSTRMGSDKAFIKLNGQSLLSRVLDLAYALTPNVSIVGDVQKFGNYGRTIPDIFANCGPLGGIHAALRASNSDLNVVLAVDTPFVSLALLQFLVERAERNPGICVTVPRTATGWQPLCAVYRRSFSLAAEQALRTGLFKIDRLFEIVPTEGISESELLNAGFPPGLFRNLNTPEDVAAVE